MNEPSHQGDGAFLREQSGSVWLSVKLQPRASKNEILGPQGNELRIRVTAPPVDSAANAALIEFLAERLDCPRGRITLVRGQTSRHKVLLLSGATTRDVLKKLGCAR